MRNQEFEQVWYSIGRDWYYGCSLDHPAVWDYIDSQILREMNQQ